MYAPSLPERVHGSAALARRQALGRRLGHLLGHLDVRGLDHIPSTGPVIIAVNHRSALDGPLLFGLIGRPVNFLVKVEAFTPRMGPVLRGAGQIPLTRTQVDAAAIRLGVQILRAGGVLGIFPEGSRGDGLVRTARPGVGYFALRSGAEVVPVACHGTDGMTHRHTLRRPSARLVAGAPIAVARYPDARPLNKHVVAVVAERIRVALADLVATTTPDAPQRKAAA